MSKILEEFSKSKGFTISNSDKHRTIINFNVTKSANILFSFLNKHSSCIAIFNAIVKSEQADIDEIIKKQTNIFNAFGTSFIYYAECRNVKCQAIHTIDISDNDFVFPIEQTKCQSCQRMIKFTISDFKPIAAIQKDDLIRFFNFISENYGLFLSKVALNCVYCANPLSPVDDDKIHNVDLVCPNCKKIRYIEPLFVIEDDIVKIIDKEQGYWLEWYVWRKLESYHPEHNITFKQNTALKEKFEADVCFFSDNKFIIIECKDTSDINSIFRKFHLISQIADKYILISTSQLDGGKLDSIKKSEIGEKFEYIPPDQIINLETIIKKVIKSLSIILPPKSNFEVNNSFVRFFGSTEFFDTSLHFPTSWNWDFGDGSTSNEQNPVHQYTHRGVFKVTLLVENEAGTDISDQLIKVLGG